MRVHDTADAATPALTAGSLAPWDSLGNRAKAIRAALDYDRANTIDELIEHADKIASYVMNGKAT